MRRDVAVAALDLIRTHYRTRGVQLAFFAVQLGISRWHLSRILREQTKYGFPHHVTCIRVLTGGLLMRCSNASVKDVAFHAGFRDSSEFDRQFRKIAGMRPSDFRSACAPRSVRASASGELEGLNRQGVVSPLSLFAEADARGIDFGITYAFWANQNFADANAPSGSLQTLLVGLDANLGAVDDCSAVVN